MKQIYKNIHSEDPMYINKLFRTLMVLALVFLLSAPGAAWALIVSGSGESRSVAVDRAKRNAVESALSRHISSSEFTKHRDRLDSEVFEDVDGYIEDFEVISTRKDKGETRVTLDVQINKRKLRSYFRKKEGWIAGDDNGRLALFLKRTTPSHLSARTREARFAYFELKNNIENDHGYEVIRNSMFGRDKESRRKSWRSRTKMRTMSVRDALEVAADLGAEHAVVFDLKINQGTKFENRLVTCQMTVSIFDTETEEEIDSYEIETDAEYPRSGRFATRQEARYKAIQTAVGQAAEITESTLGKYFSKGSIGTRRHDLLLKKFNKDEIQEIVSAIESMRGFSKLRPRRQTARSYKAQVFIKANRNEFIKELKRILDDADFQYNINFSRTNIFITKFRTGPTDRSDTGFIEM